MRRRNPAAIAVVAGVILLGTVPFAAAQSFGGGISVFVPYDMFQGETGSISFETSLETSLGLGDYLSIPVGFSYNQVYGLSPTGQIAEGRAGEGDAIATTGPWFYADSILPYLLAKIHLPLGPVYLDVYGGGAINYNFSLRPLEGRIARDLEEIGALGSAAGAVGITDLTIESGLGYGWVAGAGFGVQIDQISVGIDVSYRHIYHPLTIAGSYVEAGRPEATFDGADYIDELQVLLQGFSIGVGGSFSM